MSGYFSNNFLFFLIFYLKKFGRLTYFGNTLFTFASVKIFGNCYYWSRLKFGFLLFIHILHPTSYSFRFWFGSIFLLVAMIRANWASSNAWCSWSTHAKQCTASSTRRTNLSTSRASQLARKSYATLTRTRCTRCARGWVWRRPGGLSYCTSQHGEVMAGSRSWTPWIDMQRSSPSCSSGSQLPRVPYKLLIKSRCRTRSQILKRFSTIMRFLWRSYMRTGPRNA